MKKLLTIILFSFSICSFSQSVEIEAISSGGEYLENGNISLSTTIGELSVENFEQNNIILTQGFQQGFFNITDISTIKKNNIEISLYPNPTTDVVNITCTAHDCKYSVIDITGKTIFNGELRGYITPITLSNFNSGHFIIEIYSKGNKIEKTFKVIKK